MSEDFGQMLDRLALVSVRKQRLLALEAVAEAAKRRAENCSRPNDCDDCDDLDICYAIARLGEVD